MEMCNDNVKRFAEKRFAIGTGHIGTGIIVGMCIIRSGRGSSPILNPHKAVLLLSNFGYVYIGYSF
jgi:hypothetical protein